MAEASRAGRQEGPPGRAPSALLPPEPALLLTPLEGGGWGERKRKKKTNSKNLI